MYQSRIRDKKKRANDKKRELMEPGEDQDYGIVQDMLGNGRMRIFCTDKKIRQGRIRGSMRKYSGKVIIDKGDLVLYAGRDYGDTVDIFHKYTYEEIADLIQQNMLPDTILQTLNADYNEDNNVKNKDDYVLFVENQGSDNDDSSFDGLEGPGNEGSGSAEQESDIDIDAI